MPVRDLINAASGAGPSVTYIEDVFSTYLYTGNGATQTITNGIDLAGKGGLVWCKNRITTNDHVLQDTVTGIGNILFSDSTLAQIANVNVVSSANSNGFSLNFSNYANQSGSPTVSWTFRKAPKFFDVVTYTGTGGSQTINHSLGATPGMIIVKNLTSSTNWAVYNIGMNGGTTPQNYAAFLNLTDAQTASSVYWNNTAPTSTNFTVGGNGSVNASGASYVAYLFANDTTTNGLIQCGSFTGAATVNLGWEPQYILVKRSDSTGSWYVIDTMRGWNNTSYTWVRPDLPDSEFTTASPLIVPTATGFTTTSAFIGTWIYMAIRRGPMKTPTDGTKVFTPIAANSSSGTIRTVGFPSDMTIVADRTYAINKRIEDRLRGYANAAGTGSPILYTSSTAAEDTSAGVAEYNVWNTTRQDGGYFDPDSCVWWHFQRAPGFFDVVCYTGTGSATTVAHNLGVAPELMIVKRRNSTGGWLTYANSLGATKYLQLNLTDAAGAASVVWNDTTPTQSVFSVGSGSGTNASGFTYVAYLFASCPGVSKVGTYTGNGSSQTINCGFTNGARFVLIKRTDSTGDWWAWDTARGMVAGTDPRLALDTTAAETNANWCYTTTGGFQLVTSDASVNASGGSYIYLAVA